MKAPVARYWRVSDQYWVRADEDGWSERARTLGAYLMGCTHRTAEGLFRLPKSYICEDLSWDAERLAEPFAELLERGFIQYDERSKWLLLMTALEVQPPENPNQATAAVRRIAGIPLTSPLTCTFKRLAEEFSQRLLEALPDGFGEPIAHPQSHLIPSHAPGDEPFTPGSGTIPEAPTVDPDHAGRVENPGGNLAALDEARAALNPLPETA